MSLLRQNKPQITQITQIFVTDHHDETDYHRFGHKRPSECSHRGVSHRNQYKSVRSVSPVPHEKICEICEICGSFKQNYFLSLKEFSMLEISAWKARSIFRRCSMALQLWMTVEWSRLPMSCPIRPAGIFVYFCAKNIDT